MSLRLHCVLAWMALAMPALAPAHSLSPSLLQVRQETGDRVAFTWTTPAILQAGARVQPLVPDTCRPQTAPQIERQAAQFVVRWTMRCEQGLVGETLGATGMRQTRSNTLLHVALADGRRFEKVLTEEESRYTIPAQDSRLGIAGDYARLGIEHILLGWDHLALVIGLLLLARTRGSLIWTITAFTLGHSMTLALAVLGLVHVSQEWTEAAIASSILVVAVEAARNRAERPSLLSRHPGIAAVGFGLLHGLGFAGALAEVGLPYQQIPLALVTFNVGIEIGQLAFVTGALIIAGVWRRANGVPMSWIAQLPQHAIGIAASFWLFERLAAISQYH